MSGAAQIPRGLEVLAPVAQTEANSEHVFFVLVDDSIQNPTASSHKSKNKGIPFRIWITD